VTVIESTSETKEEEENPDVSKILLLFGRTRG
jgi:hypothetical protein